VLFRSDEAERTGKTPVKDEGVHDLFVEINEAKSRIRALESTVRKQGDQIIDIQRQIDLLKAPTEETNTFTDQHSIV